METPGRYKLMCGYRTFEIDDSVERRITTQIVYVVRYEKWVVIELEYGPQGNCVNTVAVTI